ncbi:hypothetical protein AB1L30_04930 [Bremerella sp. JC817]|uniref:hypothetical protein n=1 Tax=Bremerella sp. JC817 TaxID=3231756 RepID=UPI003459D588
MMHFRNLRRRPLIGLGLLPLIFATSSIAYGQQATDFTSQGEYPPGFIRCVLDLDRKTARVDASEVRLGLEACYGTLFKEQQIADAMDGVGSFTALEECSWSGDIPIGILLNHESTSKRLRRLKVNLGPFRSRPSEYPTLPELESLSCSCGTMSLKDAEVLEAVRKSPKLRELHLRLAKLTEVQLAELLQASSIERLTLEQCELEHNTLAAIPKSTSLTDLTVNYDGITEDIVDDLSELKRLTVIFTEPVENVDKLKQMKLSGVRFHLSNPDDARSILAALPKTHMRELSITGRLDQSLVDQIVRLPHLTRLSLQGEFDQDALERIGQAKQLEYLTIESMVLGESPRLSITWLSQLTALKRLKLSHLEIVSDPASLTRLKLPSLAWIEIVSVENAGKMVEQLLANGDTLKTIAMYPDQFNTLKEGWEIDDQSCSHVVLHLIADGDDVHDLAVLRGVLSGKPHFKTLQVVTDFIHIDEVRRIVAKVASMP